MSRISFKDLQVAIVCGVHPAIEISSSFSAPRLDELSLATTILNDLSVFRLSNDLLVPSDAEFVFEGIDKKIIAEN